MWPRRCRASVPKDAGLDAPSSASVSRLEGGSDGEEFASQTPAKMRMMLQVLCVWKWVGQERVEIRASGEKGVKLAGMWGQQAGQPLLSRENGQQ